MVVHDRAEPDLDADDAVPLGDEEIRLPAGLRPPRGHPGPDAAFARQRRVLLEDEPFEGRAAPN
ncbi:MAG: hypothetical protein IT376_07270 [Polyangiaceae bacterium]|nr:hypothetical protein [Polyangiaceae bacterium]